MKVQPSCHAIMDILACKRFPKRLLSHHSFKRLRRQNVQKNRTESASRSRLDYLRSTEAIVLLANRIGWNYPLSFFCTNNAPTGTGKASVLALKDFSSWEMLESVVMSLPFLIFKIHSPSYQSTQNLVMNMLQHAERLISLQAHESIGDNILRHQESFEVLLGWLDAASFLWN